jgi:tetraacyldisaccharide-1-P 4'-kinase
MKELEKSINKNRPDFAVTTEKDLIKIKSLFVPFPVYALRIRLSTLPVLSGI